MSQFGRTLFKGGGFIRWTLSPFILLFAVLMPLCVDEWTSTRVLFMAGVELICFLFLAGFWLPSRLGNWAFRLFAGLVALAYAAYFVYEFYFSNKALTVTGSRGDDSPFNALLGLLVIGVPSFLFAVLGRFTLRPPPPETEEHPIESNEDDP